jgi:hypothetical protein
MPISASVARANGLNRVVAQYAKQAVLIDRRSARREDDSNRPVGVDSARPPVTPAGAELGLQTALPYAAALIFGGRFFGLDVGGWGGSIEVIELRVCEVYDLFELGAARFVFR